LALFFWTINFNGGEPLPISLASPEYVAVMINPNASPAAARGQSSSDRNPRADFAAAAGSTALGPQAA
jgi:hypothetical protein